MRNTTKKIIIILFMIFISSTAFAKLKVSVSYPYIADIVERIGKNNVKVYCLAKGNWDPHFVVPRPSLIAKVRKSDLLIINGAQLEIGWIPPIIRGSRNSRVQPGAVGLLDLSAYVKLIDVPITVSRSQGDIHPAGNPHFYLNPENILLIASAVHKKLRELDPGNSLFYKQNLKAFNTLWRGKLIEWQTIMAPFKGTGVVQYHKNMDYFLSYYGLVRVTELEPLPGIPPTSGHIQKVIKRVKTEGVRFIIADVYHSQKPAKFVSKKTNAKMVVLPHDVNAVEEARDLVSLFDEIIRRLK
ncbi:MAG: zinc ABC transporter solute-binding protein [bacterium]|nr:zinc ABC transporter solute-binding protein [bacterium]